MKISDNADVKLQKTFKYYYVRQANNIILIQVKSVAFTTIYEGKQQSKSYSFSHFIGNICKCDICRENVFLMLRINSVTHVSVGQRSEVRC